MTLLQGWEGNYFFLVSSVTFTRKQADKQQANQTKPWVFGTSKYYFWHLIQFEVIFYNPLPIVTSQFIISNGNTVSAVSLLVSGSDLLQRGWCQPESGHFYLCMVWNGALILSLHAGGKEPRWLQCSTWGLWPPSSTDYEEEPRGLTDDYAKPMNRKPQRLNTLHVTGKKTKKTSAWTTGKLGYWTPHLHCRASYLSVCAVHPENPDLVGGPSSIPTQSTSPLHVPGTWCGERKTDTLYDANTFTHTSACTQMHTHPQQHMLYICTVYPLCIVSDAVLCMLTCRWIVTITHRRDCAGIVAGLTL